jgi:EAL domain-containing protein (putative c-di-GMP-specific phosphodiesterase class I)
VAIDDIDESNLFVTALRDLGCRIAIDDFGAGYTSFRNLKLLNVDMVKIDGSFISDLHRHSDNQVFVRAMIDLARKFKLATVAEWVNSEQDAAALREWGVDYLQGFLYGAASLERPWAQRRAAAAAVPTIEVIPIAKAG